MEKPAKISAIIKYQNKVLSEKNSDEKKKKYSYNKFNF